jgi:hypothetical protein
VGCGDALLNFGQMARVVMGSTLLMGVMIERGVRVYAGFSRLKRRWLQQMHMHFGSLLTIAPHEFSFEMILCRETEAAKLLAEIC